MSAEPLLSICIPTFNRAELLDLMLQSLCPQVAELDGQVEIVVSDNCSPDRTPEVVESASRGWPIRYFRNDSNVGSRNMPLVIEHARGEYCWLMGDDDMVISGALPRIIAALRDNSDVDCLYANYFMETIAVRNRIIESTASRVDPGIERCVVRESVDRRIESWELIFDLDSIYPPEVNTSLTSLVFRRRLWLRHAGELRLGGAPMISAADTTLDDLFPHIRVLGRAMMRRPVYFIAQPCLLMGQGSQDWLSDWPVVSMVGIGEALRFYEGLGFDEARMRRLWRAYFRHEAKYFPVIGVSRHLPCLEHFSFARWTWRHRHRATILAAVVVDHFASSLRNWLHARIPARQWVIMRGAYRRTHHLFAPPSPPERSGCRAEVAEPSSGAEELP